MRTGHTPHRARRGAQRGVTLIELMVGAAIALFITAAGTTLLAGNLRENRSVLLEARLMQDLRTATDVISRDLRRAGHWGAAGDGVWRADAAPVAANPYAAFAPGSAASDAVSLRYSRDATENHTVDSNEQFGYRRRNGAVEMQLGAGNWQALTDATTMTVTEFSVTPTQQTLDLQHFCATECRTGSSTCPPRQQLRSLALAISARLVADPAVTRSLRSQVRLRSDGVVGACEE